MPASANTQNGFSLTVILIAILTALIIGAGGVYVMKNTDLIKESNSSAVFVEETQKNNSVIQKEYDETVDWEIHRNEGIGFKVRYPEDWRVVESSEFSGFGPKSIKEDTLLTIYAADEIPAIGVNPDNPNQEIVKIEDFYFKELLGKKVYTKNISNDLISSRIYVENLGIIFSIGQPKLDEEHLFSIKDNSIIYEILSTFEFIGDETANWKTYRNEELGFEVKYPNSWKISEMIINNPSNLGYEVTLKRLEVGEENYKSLTISMTSKYPYLPDNNHNAPLSQTTVGGLKAKEQVFTSGYCDVLSCSDPFVGIWINKNGYIYTFNFSNTITIKDIYNQILSTFKFIGDETANWKTYQNKQYGFEFKYDPDLKGGGELTMDGKVAFGYKSSIMLMLDIVPIGISFDELQPYYTEYNPSLTPIINNKIIGGKISKSYKFPQGTFVYIPLNEVSKLEIFGETVEFFDLIFDQILSTFKFIESGSDLAKISCDYNNPNKKYAGKSEEQCSRIRFVCDIENEKYFNDECGCGCEPAT